MKKLYTLLIAVFTLSAIQAQQQILLMSEGFETGAPGFDLTTGGVGTNTGNNAWIINNQYTGAPLYPLTPPQDSVVSGTINGAPHSSYLHIHDQQAVGQGIANCNWNTNTASDRFVFIGNPFCTLGMSNVIFTFFWIGEGVPGLSYGEVYYRANGGPWIKTGQTEYSGQNKWKYEIIQDPAFDNVQNLQLGFRWVNKGDGGTSNISFGIDDIIAVGTFNANPNDLATVNITQVAPTSVCQGDFINIFYSLSKPLCDGTYQIEMSNASGSFNTPYNGGVFVVPSGVTSSAIGFYVPDSVAGNCFKIRINRLSPLPQITGTVSACFAITDCPESISTVGAPVLSDADTACKLSVIDVKFNSFGVFGPGFPVNVYTAQLSDSTGSFASPYTLGTLPSDMSYPGQPGTISGLIPGSVPPGCGYYIRVVSSLPSVVGTVRGPFCITECDVLTNEHTDLHFCIPQLLNPDGLCDTFRIQTNYWNNQASYDTCNDWSIELRSMMNFGLVNSGGLGVYHDSVGGYFGLCVPPVREQLPVAPGAYYMRIVSNCTNLPWNQNGTVIRVTIGAPDTLPPDIIIADTIACNTGLLQVFVNPFNHPPSDYEWSSNLLNNGNAFTWEFNPLQIDLSNSPLPGTYVFYVREKNFGCYGPSASRTELTLISRPNPVITGPIQVCLGDTVNYRVGYIPRTYYNWDAPTGVSILDEANSETTVIFDSVGTFTLSNFSLNDCGGDSDKYTVNVVTLFNVNAGADKEACTGDTVTLNAVSGDLDKLLITSDTATASHGAQGAMFNIKAHADVIIDSFAVKYSTSQAVFAEIYGKTGSFRTFEQSQFSWNQLGAYFNFIPSPVGQFTVIPVFVNQHIAAGDTFAFYVTTANATPVVKQAYSPGNGLNGSVYKTDGIIDFIQGTINDYPFGAFTNPRVVNIRVYYSTKQGLSYYWNTGDTAATIRFPAEQSGDYAILVYDTSGCQNRDTVHLTVKPIPVVDAGPDTLLCGGSPYTMQGSSTAITNEWNPADGLSNADVLNPTWSNNQPARYYLRGTNDVGCSSTDSVYIDVHEVLVNAGPDTSLCDGQTALLQGTASTANILWSPATGLSDVTVLNPQFNNAESVEYVLVATDSFGCKASDTVLINIGKCQSYLKVPQAFTPGSDGHNDLFTVFGKNIDQYEIRIYNRWGELVYHSRDVNELNNGGWDGTFKGALQQTGTFVYYITARDSNNQPLEKKGNLTLIR